MAHLALFGLDESHCRTRRQGRRKNKKRGGDAVEWAKLSNQSTACTNRTLPRRVKSCYVLCTPYEAANGLGDGPWWVACSKPRVHDGNCNRRLAEKV